MTKYVGVVAKLKCKINQHNTQIFRQNKRKTILMQEETGNEKKPWNKATALFKNAVEECTNINPKIMFEIVSIYQLHC